MFSPHVYKVYVIQVAGPSIWIASPPAVINAPLMFSNFSFIRAGDINGDGHPDLVGYGNMTLAAGAPNATHLVYLLGIPTQPYFVATVTMVTLPANGTCYLEGLADVNNDGLADAIVRLEMSTTSVIVVFLGSQTSPFGTMVQTPTGLWLGASPAIADLDGDDAADYVASTGAPPGTVAGGLAFCRGDGQGGFRPPMTIPTSATLNPFRSAVADENGDGVKDLVYPSGSVTVLRNQSRIGFGGFGAIGPPPQMTSGIATPGNPFFHVGIIGGAPNSLAVLGISLGLLAAPQSSGLVIDPSSLILPTSSFGTFTTDAFGGANWSFGLPAGPALLGQTVYLQWAIADPGALSGSGFRMTPGRKTVFW